MNLCLYGPKPRWTMTERGRADVERTSRGIAIGPSRLEYEGDRLVAEIDERATPIPRAARGRIVVEPHSINPEPFRLDPAGRHVWHPVAPTARVSVRMSAPNVSWSGSGYVDMNHGDEPLEAGFRAWNWSRSKLADGAVVFYEGVLRDGTPFAKALRFGRDGRASPIAAPALQPLMRTTWLLPRATRSDARGATRIVRTLEDTPFYTRTVLSSRLFGETVPTMHESVDLDRFASRWVQSLLPYRMPRKPSA